MKILIATDGSEFSKAAIDEACKVLLNHTNASIRIVSAFDPSTPISAEPYVGTAVMYQEYADCLKSLAEKAASDAVVRIHNKCSDANVDVDIIMGKPHGAILDAAKRWASDLIVVGSHGHGFWGRALLGSVSSAIVHHAHCSVLVVRSSDDHNGNKNEMSDRRFNRP